MHTLKFGWSDERIEAVRTALENYLCDPTGFSSLDADIRGALADIAMFREAEKNAVATLPDYGAHQQTVMNLVIEVRAPGKPWITWDLPPQSEMIAKHEWRNRLPGADHRENLECQLIRRTAVVTDEVLDTEGGS